MLSIYDDRSVDGEEISDFDDGKNFTRLLAHSNDGDSVTRLGEFERKLGTNFLSKIAEMLSDFCQKWHFLR